MAQVEAGASDAHGPRAVVHTDGTVDYIDADAIGGEMQDMPKGYFRSLPFLGTVLAQCLGSIVAYMGWVLPANTLTLINAELGNSPNINWVATVWTLSSCVGFLLIGRLSDIFGRKWIVQGSMVLSIIGCIMGARATYVEMLIGANVFNGIAAAGQLSFGIILGELVPNKYRGVIVTIVFMSSLPFAVFGPVIARLLIQNTEQGWRWSYYIGLILAVIATGLYHFLYHPPKYAQLHVGGQTKWQMFKELDFVGIFLFVAGCVLFLIGLSWGGTTYPWVSAPTLCTILLGLVTIAAFILYEGFICKTRPFMPPRLFKHAGFVAIVVNAAVASMVYYSFTVLWPTIISSIYTTDSIQVGLQSSVVGGGILLGQIMGGMALGFLPGVKYQCIIASCLAISFITPLSALGPDTWEMTIALGVLGCIAVGYIENITFPGVTLVVEPQDIGLATGVLGSLRALGGAIAQAVYVSVLDNELQKNIPAYVGPAATSAGLPESSLAALLSALSASSGTSSSSLDAVPGINDGIVAAASAAMKVAYSRSFRIVFFCTVPFSVVLIVSSCFVPNMGRFTHLNVARRLQGGKQEKGEGEEEDDGKGNVQELEDVMRRV
ncbi:fungal trichothecene efflux pump [Aspergillus pseudodeflectus]|uniref:Fungal trichothecene efflux pump n=1 Tax=Aspergillus pseudodeflectus TaxID=176178 RepID=A0ABR4KGR2_9EURO